MKSALDAFVAVFAFLLLLSAFAVMLGAKPKPCPRHIYFPRSEIVPVEQLLAQGSELAKRGHQVASER